MAKARAIKAFSVELHDWFKDGHDKTLLGLSQLFAEKSFAIIFLLLMTPSALPIPTGGITHVFQLIVMLLCLEMIIGRRALWLPKRWLKVNVGKLSRGKAAKKLISIIEWFERWSRRRGSRLMTLRWTRSFIGLIILIFTIAAFGAPPFTGLDTLPSLGVVIISLALILEDILILISGVIVGIVGIGLELAAGTALYSGITHFF